MRFVALCGLEAEAKLLRQHGVAALVTGGDQTRGAAMARQLANGDAEALLSFGICGGLRPDLKPGDLLVPHFVVDEQRRSYSTDDTLREDLRRALRKAGVLRAMRADLIGLEMPVSSAGDKAALYQRHGMAAVDLESLALARAAHEAKKPFLVMRAVADPAERGLPPAALVGLDAQGRTAYGAVLKSVLRNPAQIPALMELARDSKAAFATLRGAIAAAADLFAR